MRITQITTVHPRNDTRVALKECPDLVKIWGSEVRLLVADGKGDAQQAGVRIIDVGKPPGGRVGRFFLGSLYMLKWLLKLKPRVVHFHDPELIPVGFLCKLSGMSVIYDVHESVPEIVMKREWLPKWLRRPVSGLVDKIEKLAGRCFDRVVVVTTTIGKRFPEFKTVLVQNFPLTGELVTTGGQPYEKRPHDFAYVGGVSRVRAAIEMVQAIGILSRDDQGAGLQMAGPFRSNGLLHEVEQLDGWKDVTYREWVDRQDMAILLGGVRAGLVLFHPAPNHLDSQPNKLFEYMSAGIPVIASDFPLWREIVEGAKAGLLVDPRNPDAIAEAMRWILGNPEQAEQMGENGKQAVDTKYNWDAESQKLIKMYRELLGDE